VGAQELDMTDLDSRTTSASRSPRPAGRELGVERPGGVAARPRPAALVVVAAVATLAAALGLLPRWQGTIHLVALPPLDLVADLQLVLVRAPGIPEAVLATVASLAIRSAVLAWMLGGLDRARWLYALRFYVVVLPFAVLAAMLRFASMAVLFYLLFWLGFALTLALLAATAAMPWLGADTGRLRTGLSTAARHGFRLGTIGAYVAGLTALGVLADLGGEVTQVLLVPVSAALTYGAALLLMADPGYRVARRVVAAAPAAGLVALLAVVLLGPAGPPEADDDGRADQDGSILLMSGIDSSSGSGAILELDPTAVLGWSCERTYHFSYAGTGDGQPQGDARCPIPFGSPYEAEDTLRSRDDLIPALEAFVAEMPPPVVVAGHSQGAWLVWEAAVQDRLPGVEVVVLVGGFPENRVTYTEWGDRGPGSVGRYLLDIVENVPRPGGTTVFDADSPLGREWLAHPDAVREVMASPLPDGMRGLSIASTFDLPLLHGTHRVDGATDACAVPVMHPNLPYAEELQEAIARFAAGEDLPDCGSLRTITGPLLRHLSPPPSPRMGPPG
jgi:hypothetical protein